MPWLPLRQLCEDASPELCCSAKQGPIKFYYRQHQHFFYFLFTLILEFTLNMICIIIMNNIYSNPQIGSFESTLFFK